MANEDDGGEKTEEPTAKRREKFREEGNIAQSKDIGNVAVLIAALLIVIHLGAGLAEQLMSDMAMDFETIASMSKADAKAVLARIGVSSATTYASVVAPFAITAALIGAVAGIAQTGGNFTFKPLKPKFTFLNLASGIKRILISPEALQRVGLSMLKAGAIGIALYFILDRRMDELVALARVPLTTGLMTLGSLCFELVVASILATSVIAAIDFILSKMRIEKRMKMSKQEVKDERKQSEGDQQVKQRLRSRMFEIGYNNMLAAAKDADVVVVNPTHYAVALAYDAEHDEAPRLVAKGKNETAKKIRQIARENNIPIIANPPVARAIFDIARVDAELPGELYKMVARVLAYLYRMQGKVAA